MYIFRCVWLLFLISMPLCLLAQKGPGGVENTDGTTDLRLWLEPNTGVTQNGSNVSQWADQSGYDNHIDQGNSGNQPEYLPNTLNGHPVIRFDQTNNEWLESSGFNSKIESNFAMVFVVKQNGNLTDYSSIFSSSDANSTKPNKENIQVSADNQNPPDSLIILGASERVTISDLGDYANYSILFIRRTTVPSDALHFYRNGSNIKGVGIGSDLMRRYELFRFGRNRSTNQRYFDGDLVESAIFYDDINNAERINLENYLSGKYNISISSDKYTEQSGYKHQIAGIGRANNQSQKNTSANSGGFVMEAINSTLDINNEFIHVGHDNASGTTISDLPNGVKSRWKREWYKEKNANSNGVDLTITFDFEDAGFSEGPSGNASDYTLLFRNSTSNQFTEVSVNSKSFIGDNRVEFDVSGNNLQNGYYTLGTKDDNNSPLPVELLSFSGSKHKQHVDLKWTTASEKNNSHFVIEKSSNGEHFEKLGSVSGQGNSLNETHYQYKDENPHAGTNYYRLQQVDFDGSHEYSKIIAIDYQKTITPEITLLTNPVKESLNFKIDQQTALTKAQIYNLNGRELSVVSLDPEATHSIDVNSLESGSYILRVTTRRGAMFHKKFIKQ